MPGKEKEKTQKALQAARERASAQPRDSAAHEQLAAAYHERARLKEAEAAYRRAIDLDATKPALLNSLGNVLADAGRLRDAVGCYEQANQVAGPEGDLEATCNLELARLELTQIVEPLEKLEAAAQRPGADVDVRCALACGRVLTGDLGAALAGLHAVLSEDPARSPAAVALGVVAAMPLVSDAADADAADRTRRDLIENALAAVRQAALRHPRDAELQLHQGELLELLGRSKEARSCLLRAIENDPYCLEACDLASRYAHEETAAAPFEDLLMKREQEAAETFTQSRDNAGTAFAYGAAKLALARFQSEPGAHAYTAARDVLERAVQLDRRHAEAHRLLAWVLDQIGSPQRALDLLERARELAPTRVATRMDLGRAYLRLGHIDEAFAEFQEACRLAPCDAAAALALHYAFRTVRSLRVAEFQFSRRTAGEARPDALLALIEAQVEALQLADAADNCERLLSRHPACVPGLLLAGRVAHRLGDLVGAEKHLRAAVKLQPQSAEVHRRLGQLLASQSGRLDEAIAALAKAQQLANE